MAAENTYSGLNTVTTRRLNQYHEGAVKPLKQTAEAAATAASSASDTANATANAVAALGLSVVNGAICVTYDDGN